MTETAPAQPGESISVFMTGLGLTDTTVATGAGAPSDPLANVLNPPAVTLDGSPVAYTFAGPAPGAAGIYRIDMKVPDDAKNGDLVLLVTSGSGAVEPGFVAGSEAGNGQLTYAIHQFRKAGPAGTF